MNSSSIDIFIVSDNPLFTREFLDIISNYPNLKIVEQVNNINLAIPTLEDLFARQIKVDLLILQSSLSEGKSRLEIYQQLSDSYPDLPVFILSSKQDSLKQLLPVFTKLAEDKKSLPTARSSKDSWGEIALKKTIEVNARSGLKQIQAHLDRVDDKLASLAGNLEGLDKKKPRDSKLFLDLLFWQGRRRELLATKLLIEKLVPAKEISLDRTEYAPPETEDNSPPQQEEAEKELKKNTAIAPLEIGGELAEEKLFKERVLDKISTRIQVDIVNATDIILEIDILKSQKRLRLFEVVFGKFKDHLKYLSETIDREEEEKQKKKSNRAKQNKKLSKAERLSAEIKNILLRIWEESTWLFLEECLPATGKESIEEYNVQNIIAAETKNVREEILNKIPLIEEAFAYLLLKKQFKLEKKPQTTTGSESSKEIEVEKSVEIVIQNLIIKIANAVVAVILNNFVRIECIEKNVYKRSLISSREMAKIRNNLSWRYRREKYIEEPKNIFESQYRLFYFNGNKIYTGYFFDPRTEELSQLKGLPWLTTIAIETRDALAPILQAVVEFAGEAIFYLLKDVIGRGIGLIGQGIIQGVGNALQDNRYSKNNKSTK